MLAVLRWYVVWSCAGSWVFYHTYIRSTSRQKPVLYWLLGSCAAGSDLMTSLWHANFLTIPKENISRQNWSQVKHTRGSHLIVLCVISPQKHSVYISFYGMHSCWDPPIFCYCLRISSCNSISRTPIVNKDWVVKMGQIVMTVSCPGKFFGSLWSILWNPVVNYIPFPHNYNANDKWWFCVCYTLAVNSTAFEACLNSKLYVALRLLYTCSQQYSIWGLP